MSKDRHATTTFNTFFSESDLFERPPRAVPSQATKLSTGNSPTVVGVCARAGTFGRGHPWKRLRIVACVRKSSFVCTLFFIGTKM